MLCSLPGDPSATPETWCKALAQRCFLLHLPDTANPVSHFIFGKEPLSEEGREEETVGFLKK